MCGSHRSNGVEESDYEHGCLLPWLLRQHRASQKAGIYDGRIEGKDGVGVEQMPSFT